MEYHSTRRIVEMLKPRETMAFVYVRQARNLTQTKKCVYAHG